MADRIITFEVAEGVFVTLEENDETGAISMRIVAPAGVDLRGVYFDTLGDPSLTVQGPDVTNTVAGDVLSAGPGTAMNGKAKGFDHGASIGTPGKGRDVVSETELTISSEDGPLTLDMLSQQLLGLRIQGLGEGGQKIVFEMPSAPDARDDIVDAVEDTRVTFDVLSNDTDQDGDALAIIAVDDPTHGTAMIVDNKIVYLADEHWSGIESFTYRIADGTGGFDTATITVDVEAVADAPTLSATASAGSSVNEIVIDITSALVDTDGSESYWLTLSGIPAGVLVNGVGLDASGRILMPSGSDRIILTLPSGEDVNFDLGITATSREASNGDMASTSTSLAIALDWTSTTGKVEMMAIDQSQWTTGDQITLSDNRFIGIDEDGSGGFGSFLSGSGSYDVRIGLQSSLNFEGGSVDATVPYDITVESSWNRTTDMLQLETAASLASGGSFSTDGPELSYVLDFIFDVYLQAKLFIDIVGLEVDLFNEKIDINETFNLITFDSDTSPSIGYDFPYGISSTLTWPNLEVTGGGGTTGTYTGSGASNNFLDLNFDIDDAITQALGLPVNPFDLEVDLTVAWAGLELLDADIFAGLNFLQEFVLEAGDLDAVLLLEDGSTQDFTLGDTLIFEDASDLDVNGDGDIDFEIALALEGSTFTNDTDLGFNAGWNFDLISGYAGYDIGVADGETSFGPLLDLGDTYDIASVDLYQKTFELLFDTASFEFMA